MPYALPTSSTPSPVKETHPIKQHMAAPAHIENVDAGPSYSHRAMPVIPRRASSNHSASSTPRRGLSPAVSRQPSVNQAFSASRPLEGLLRRVSHERGALGGSGMPSGLATESSLGLKLHPSPKGTTAPELNESISSTSTIDSSLPPTPADSPQHLAHLVPGPKTGSIPFPEFEPPPKAIPHHLPRLSSPGRPGSNNVRRVVSQSHHRGHNGGHTGSLQINFSASASDLVQPQPTSYAMRPTASMIRKKSGEVVKPSLKMRSLSTPDLTRSGEASDPSTPEPDNDRAFPDERSKSVRFAGTDDGEDGALENVVLFLREQKPTAVSRAIDPERAGMTETETENDTDASDFVQFRTRKNAAARAKDEEERWILEGGSRVPRTRVDFAPEARGSLDDEMVVLERVELGGNTGAFGLKGQVIVRNAAFHKWVAVRFTMDHWQTVSEVSAAHVCHIPSATTGDEGWDRFVFTIKLEDFKRKLDERQLIMCVRFSVDNQEWWDSNDGMNYNFQFKKALPKRMSRMSTPPSFGGGVARFGESNNVPMHGLRANRSVSPAAQINKAFGADDQPVGPRSWVFPRLVHRLSDTPSRSESPALSGPPPSAYKVPGLPDPHTHLSLSHYCAPSPPQSPLKDAVTVMSPPLALPGLLEGGRMGNMNVIGGQLATTSPMDVAHERSSSWAGQAGSWDSFTQAMENVSHTPTLADGEITPVAPGSRSPAATRADDSDSSPERKPLGLKRSQSNLRDLMNENVGLMTPPPSNLSSPPSPAATELASVPMSPSPSLASTGESSPLNTISGNSTPDMSGLQIEVDPEERGRHKHKDFRNSYQEFLDRFCFFQSPSLTPHEELPSRRTNYVSSSDSSSPSGFPFYNANSHRDTTTPTRQYDSSEDAFSFMPAVPAFQGQGNRYQSNLTPRASPNHGYAAPTDPRTWANHLHGNSSPSLTTAK